MSSFPERGRHKPATKLLQHIGQSVGCAGNEACGKSGAIVRCSQAVVRRQWTFRVLYAGMLQEANIAKHTQAYTATYRYR